MSGRVDRRWASTTAVALCAAVTVALLGLAVWARALNGPLWPAVLTDWSLGSVLLALASLGIGTVVVRRLPRNLVGWLFVANGLLTGAVFAAREATTLAMSNGGGGTWTAWVFAALIPLNMTLLALLALLFPYGMPPSARWRPAVWAVTAAGGVATVVTMLSPYAPDQTPFAALANPTAVLPEAVGTSLVETASTALLVSLLLGAAALIHRLRRSRGVERQQVKWFAFAVCVAVATFIAGIWLEPVFVLATLVALPALPVAAGLAVLRYRLYDIDRVISRTVAYALLTLVLGAVYVGGITVTTALTSPVAGDSTLAVAASTLAAAAAFGPARQRIQTVVDHRFNRARYDAEQIAAAYRARLRDEIDLASLHADLLGTVGSTVQPSSALLWLSPASRSAA